MRIRSSLTTSLSLILLSVPFGIGCIQARSPLDTTDDSDNPVVDAGQPPEKYDLPPPVVVDKCVVPPDSDDGIPMSCEMKAPADSFSPTLKWSWMAPGNEGSIVTPLVANLTDDNSDGKINLCDTPDVLVAGWTSGKLYLLAGDTGKLETTFDGVIDGNVNPAIGDLDGDGIPEVVANDLAGHLVAYDNTGKIKWVSSAIGAYKRSTSSYCHALAIYDLDGDGKPEIIVAFEVFDNKGNRLFGHDETASEGMYWCPANTAADLDGDGKLEVIFGNAAYHADGTLYWTIPGPPGQPQVANLDTDPEPEIFIARQDGILILENDGKIKLGPVRPISDPASPNCWSKPGAIHDFDGDGIADISASTCAHYGVYKTQGANLTVSWSQAVSDPSGLASSTAFDFLGGGVAQAVYGDEIALYVFDGKTGMTKLTKPRSSGTLIEYPVVADVDNDQSADIVVISNSTGGPLMYPTVQVFQDAEHRWIPTRRIWNQHAYHVTNVREDGTIPKQMKKNWQQLNTFRTNAQVEKNGACAPPIPG